MIAIVLLTLLALPALLFVWSALSLQANKAKAKATGLPMLVRWVAVSNPFWMMFGSSIVLKCRALGIGTQHFRRFYTLGWEANERYLVHQELGPVFMLVSPGGNLLCVSDSSVFADVIHRRTDFRRNMDHFAVLNVYGKNLSTTDDEEWQKHRKVTTIIFTDNNNELVWQQSLLQARGMLAYWLERPAITTTAEDAKVFTLNVLAAAIYNRSYPFEGAIESKPHVDPLDDSYQYRDSLGKILSHIIPIFIFGEEGMKAWWTPDSWKSVATAISTFRSYVMGLVNEERENMEHGINQNQHLVAALVRACEGEKAAEKIPSSEPRRNMTLSEEEIVSNLFVYAFAGNDTTAIALTHLLIDLAASPETQNWIAEEIRYYLPEHDTSKWAYKTFPNLKRCLAVVMESLRLNHPVGQLVKQTGNFSQTLKIGSRNIRIPAGTSIHLSLSAMHTHPQYWGADSLKWNPSRFISRSDDTEESFENEILAADTQEHFLPWATGQRVCPGKKFSQVELVATLAFIFRDYTVQPQPQRGESMDDARKRIFKTGSEIEHEGKILHEIRYPRTIALTYTKREE